MSNAVLYLVTVLIWGSTFFAIEFQLGTVAPEVSVVYRFFAAAFLLFAWCRIRGLRLHFNWRAHVWFAVLGVLLFGLNYVLAYRAQIYITSALTAIAFSTIVVLNIINARIIFGVRAGAKLAIGVALGVAGIVTIFAPQVGDFSLSDQVLVGTLLAFLGAAAASFGNMTSQAMQKKALPVVQSNAWGMFYGAISSLLITLSSGHTFNFDWSVGYVTSLVYLTLFGSIVAFGAYLTLLGRIGAHKAGYAMVMFPVVALILSVLFEGLEITTSLIVGSALVLAGNFFVVRPESGRTKPEAGDPTSSAREPA